MLSYLNIKVRYAHFSCKVFKKTQLELKALMFLYNLKVKIVYKKIQETSIRYTTFRNKLIKKGITY